VLRVEVIEDPSLNRSVLVSPDGRISMPLTGAIKASGKTIEDIQRELASGLAASFAARPNVFVAVERLFEPRIRPAATPAPDPTIEIFVMGEVGKPGKVTKRIASLCRNGRLHTFRSLQPGAIAPGRS